MKETNMEYDLMREAIQAVVQRHVRVADPTVEALTEDLHRIFRVSYDAIKEWARDDADNDWRCTLKVMDGQTYPINRPLYDRAWETVKFIRHDEVVPLVADDPKAPVRCGVCNEPSVPGEWRHAPTCGFYKTNE